MNEQEIYRAALALWGADAQTLVAFEEMAELQKELCKYARGRNNREAIAEEIADVEIMLGQMKILHDCADAVEEYRENKLWRLADRCGLEVPPQGESPEPATLGPGMVYRNGRAYFRDGAEETTEDMIRRVVREMFKEWKESAEDGGCIVIPPEVSAQIEREAAHRNAALARLRNLYEYCKVNQVDTQQNRDWKADTGALEYAINLLGGPSGLQPEEN